MAMLWLIVAVCSATQLIRKEMMDELKKTATWTVAEYENNIFKGMTVEELVSNQEYPIDWTDDVTPAPQTDVKTGNINWMEKSASCIHEVGNQGSCVGAPFAFAIAGMLSDRACLKGKDFGWLSTMELVSCDDDDYGCAGGWPAWAAKYTETNGLVDDKCYPFSGRNEACPTKCKDGSDWKKAHAVKCTNILKLTSLDAVKAELNNGPVVVTFEAYEDFYHYSSGIYCYTTGNFRRLMSARVVGFSDQPSPHVVLAMSFGTTFGEKGLVRMCTTCCGMFGKYDKGNVACTPAY